jgi:hypothetical protein
MMSAQPFVFSQPSQKDESNLTVLSTLQNRSRFVLALLIIFLQQFAKPQPKIPDFKVSARNNLEGYYFFSPIKIGKQGAVSFPSDLILDGKGQLVYIRNYKNGTFSGGLKKQSDNCYSFFYGDKFFLMDSLFNVYDSIACKNGLVMDPRDLQISGAGNYLLIGSETLEQDLSKQKLFNNGTVTGNKNSKLKCDVIQELDKNKRVIFEWHGKDHFSLEDVDPEYLTDPVNIDWLHFNAVHYDTDGNILLSIKKTNQVVKISRANGNIIWRLGGKKNEFIFTNDSAMFKGQHDIRRLKNGHITLFDNGCGCSPPHPESAKEYVLDEQNKKAIMVWQYKNNPKYHSLGYCNVQRLPDGKTLVNYGRSDHLNVIFNLIDKNGKKIFEVSSNDSLRNYRAYFYPEVSAKFTLPSIRITYRDSGVYLCAGQQYKNQIWSNGQTNSFIQVTKPGVYRLFVPFGPGYVSSAPVPVTLTMLRQRQHDSKK